VSPGCSQGYLTSSSHLVSQDLLLRQAAQKFHDTLESLGCSARLLRSFDTAWQKVKLPAHDPASAFSDLLHCWAIAKSLHGSWSATLFFPFLHMGFSLPSCKTLKNPDH
jgi:hypothetical protein